MSHYFSRFLYKSQVEMFDEVIEPVAQRARIQHDGLIAQLLFPILTIASPAASAMT
jgi:hypothetical protein